jgi:hypothetical protein
VRPFPWLAANTLRNDPLANLRQPGAQRAVSRSVESGSQAELVAVPDSGPEDGWLRGADRIAAYIDCRRSRVYALTSARRIPVHHDGSALVARRSELDQWLRDGGGLRP